MFCNSSGLIFSIRNVQSIWPQLSLYLCLCLFSFLVIPNQVSQPTCVRREMGNTVDIQCEKLKQGENSEYSGIKGIWVECDILNQNTESTIILNKDILLGRIYTKCLGMLRKWHSTLLTILLCNEMEVQGSSLVFEVLLCQSEVVALFYDLQLLEIVSRRHWWN
jgi:hypothetical protein